MRFEIFKQKVRQSSEAALIASGKVRAAGVANQSLIWVSRGCKPLAYQRGHRAGKGCLYHFFPGGKEEMADAVLSEIDGWFENHVFAPLQKASRPEDAISAMFDSVDAYFRSGRRVCLVGALALGDTRDRFASEVRSYFSRWVDALSGALIRSKRSSASARALAEEVVAGIQGAIVLARAFDDPRAFARALVRMRNRVAKR